ncbi:protein kinase domain-containing protein [Streptomyces justiciae]|uniref:protein kinase domain-containing protein n=1 Tax=Streptomyces justiciae TaxID=2780140 RepID=UPI002117EA79|nr:protein kinase [Streptomyces justiciae]MCW8382347.1 PQQ-binding-like beta-propeller repeat protein [Streptomyces justiciae]
MPLHKDDPKSVGGYKLVDRLGSGGMGVVYWGRSRSGRDVAVKVVHAQYAEDKVFRARFRQEIDAVRKVSGAFTAPVVDADPEAVRPWMATQYVPGSSLAERIRDHGALKGPQLRRLALGLVEALQDIHRAGVVHRDLKPANVLMAEDGPRVIDFGISRAAENHQTLTETGQMIGTPPFMSPEQFTDARTVGPASDVFSLAALLVFSATGRGPFDADSPYMTAFRVVHEPPGLDGVPRQLRAVLERCLVKNPAERPQLDVLAKEFADALPEPDPMDPDTTTLRLADLRTVEETYGGTGSAAPTTSGRRRRSRRLLLAVTAAVGALTLGALGYAQFGAADDSATVSDDPGSRWAALPDGWQPWRTTVAEPAQWGEIQPLGTADGEVGDASCVRGGDAVYCAGATVLPERLDARTGDTVWRASLASTGTTKETYDASILGVHDGTVLIRQSVAGVDSSRATVHVIALDVKRGDELWRREVNDQNAQLIMSGEIVLTVDPGGRIVTARDPRTGLDRWTSELPSGSNCAFLTVGTALYEHCFPQRGGTDAQLLRLDRSDGSVVKRIKTPYDSGVAGTVEGLLAVLPANNSGPDALEDSTFSEVLLIEPDTGKRTTIKLPKTYTGSTTLAGGTLWIAEADGRVSAVNPLTGKESWRTSTGVENAGPPTYDAKTGTVYVASPSGRVTAIDTRTGDKLWETGTHAQRISGGGDTAKAQVLPYGGALITVTPDGTVFSLDPADPSDPEEDSSSG